MTGVLKFLACQNIVIQLERLRLMCRVVSDTTVQHRPSVTISLAETGECVAQ